MRSARYVGVILVGFSFLACDSDESRQFGREQGALGSTSLVISQVYGGGGNVHATHTNDFIEIVNPTLNPVSVDGWSVQYAGPVTSSWQVTNLSGVVGAHRYYLIAEAIGLGGTTPLPQPDAVGTIPMGSATGKVALVRTQTPLSCGTSCLPNPDVADFVGYGFTASSFEGSGPAPATSNTTSDSRAISNVDTDDNAADFHAGEVAPRNSTVCERPTGSGGLTGAPPVCGTGGTSGS